MQVTDSPYVVASMGIMTRTGTPVLDKLAEGVDFVRCQHSLGRPLPLKGTVAPPAHPSGLLPSAPPPLNSRGLLLLQLLWSTRGPATRSRC